MKDRSLFEGFFLDDKKHGKGRWILKQGGVIEGEWDKGKVIGSGIINLPDGSTYEGEWKDDMQHG